MTYEFFLQHLFSLGRFGIKPGLERVGRLLQLLGNPQERLRAVHVVGTNGKGSTSSFLSSILTRAGYRTGLFTSPHLVSFTERMQIDGAQIDRDDVLRIGMKILEIAPQETTFFEIVTAMAIVHFVEQGVDIAVLEAGMGGGNDATASVSGMITAVTPISFDHAAYLGDDLHAIAREKASIIRRGTTVVSGTQVSEIEAILDAVAVDRAVTHIKAGMDFRCGWSGEKLWYESRKNRFENLVPGLRGRYQADNAACAIAVAETLDPFGFSCGSEAIIDGIAAARWPGRMEIFPGSPRILLDGAHNPAGARALAESLAFVPHRKVIGVIGIMDDKDVAGVVKPLLGYLSAAYCAAPSVGRAVPAVDLVHSLSMLGLNAASADSVASALDAACAEAGAEDLVLVFGSLFAVGEARAHLLDVDYQGVRG